MRALPVSVARWHFFFAHVVLRSQASSHWGAGSRRRRRTASLRVPVLALASHLCSPSPRRVLKVPRIDKNAYAKSAQKRERRCTRVIVGQISRPFVFVNRCKDAPLQNPASFKLGWVGARVVSPLVLRHAAPRKKTGAACSQLRGRCAACSQQREMGGGCSRRREMGGGCSRQMEIRCVREEQLPCFAALASVVGVSSRRWALHWPLLLGHGRT